MKTLIINIKQLVQVEKAPRTWVAGDDMSRLESISNAWLYTENGKIAEHWDVMETIADKATWQNQNGKF